MTKKTNAQKKVDNLLSEDLEQAPEEKQTSGAFTVANVQGFKSKTKSAIDSYKNLVPLINKKIREQEDPATLELLYNLKIEANFLYTKCILYNKILNAMVVELGDIVKNRNRVTEPNLIKRFALKGKKRISSAFQDVSAFPELEKILDNFDARIKKLIDALNNAQSVKIKGGGEKQIKWKFITSDGKTTQALETTEYREKINKILTKSGKEKVISFALEVIETFDDDLKSIVKRIDTILGLKKDKDDDGSDGGGYYEKLTRPLTALEEITANLNLKLEDIDQEKLYQVVVRVEDRLKVSRPESIPNQIQVIDSLTAAIKEHGYNISQIEKNEEAKKGFHELLTMESFPDLTTPEGKKEFAQGMAAADEYFSKIVEVLVKALKKKGDKEKSTGRKTTEAEAENLINQSKRFMDRIQRKPPVFFDPEAGAVTANQSVKIDDIYSIKNDFFTAIQNNPDQLKVLQALVRPDPNKQLLMSLPFDKIKEVFQILPKIPEEKFLEQKRDLSRLVNYYDSMDRREPVEAPNEVPGVSDGVTDAFRVARYLESFAASGTSEEETAKAYSFYYDWLKENKPDLVKYFTTGGESKSEPQADPEQPEEPEVKQRPEELAQVFEDVEFEADEEEALIELYEKMKEQGLVSENKEEEAITKFLQNLPVNKEGEKYQALLRGLRKLHAAGKLEQFAKIIKKPEVKQDSALWSEKQGVELNRRVEDFVKSREDLKDKSPREAMDSFINKNWSDFLVNIFPTEEQFKTDIEGASNRQKKLDDEISEMIQDEIEMQSKIDTGPEEEGFTEKDKRKVQNAVIAILSNIPETKKYKVALDSALQMLDNNPEVQKILDSKDDDGIKEEILEFAKDFIRKKTLERYPEVQGKSEVVNYFRKTSERAKDFVDFKSKFSALLPDEEKTKLSWYRAFTLMLMLRENSGVSEIKMPSELTRAVSLFKLDKAKLSKLTQKTLNIINELILKFKITRIKKYIQENDLLTKIPIVKTLPSDFGIKDFSVDKEAPSESDPDEQEKEKAVQKVIKKSVEGKPDEAKEDIENSKIFDQQDMEEVKKIPEAVEALKEYFQFLYKYIKSKKQTNENIMSKIRRTISKKSSSAEFFNQLAKYLSQGDQRQIGEKIKKKHLELNKDRYTPGKEDGKKREGLFPKLPEILKELWGSDEWGSSLGFGKEAAMDAYKIPFLGKAKLTGTLIKMVFDHYFKGIVNKEYLKQRFIQRIKGSGYGGLRWDTSMDQPGNSRPMRYINDIYREIAEFKETASYKEFTDKQLLELQKEIDEVIEKAKNVPKDDRKRNDDTKLKPEVRLTRSDVVTEIKINKLVKVLKPYLLHKLHKEIRYEKTN